MRVLYPGHRTDTDKARYRERERGTKRAAGNVTMPPGTSGPTQDMHHEPESEFGTCTPKFVFQHRSR